MQATRNTSPITILHEDLLWKIFLEITNDARELFLPDTRPISTIRRCSQVHRHWRSLILSSSSIWGRLIDMNALRRKTDDWMKEVVRRAGDALLWVYGEVGDSQRHHFLFDFLQENWRRVEMLVVTWTFWTLRLPSEDDTQLQRMKWAFLQEPAPCLRWFGLSARVLNICKLLPEHLFAGNAPLLTDFRIYRDSEGKYKYKFSTQASWIPNLSAVTFSEEFTVAEVLNALRKMPRLQYLSLYVKSSSGSAADFRGSMMFLPALRTLHCLHRDPSSAGAVIQCITPSADCAADFRGSMVILPKLRMVHMHGDLSSAGTVLQSIMPSTDCCLRVEVDRYVPLPALAPVGHRLEYQRYEAMVAKYLIPYFSLHPPSSVVFYFGRESCRFYDGHVAQQSPNYQFLFSQYTRYLPSSSLMEEFNDFTSFSQVRILHLKTSQGEPFILKELGALSIRVGDSFRLITTLSAEEWILHSLVLQEPSITATRSLFPALTTLLVPDLSGTKHVPNFELVVPPHQQFIQLRKAIGRPLSVLEIPPTSPAIWKGHDMAHLDVHIGLLVKWKFSGKDPEEYVCGSGHPERLRFDRKKW
ncbi:hypothetical protein D9613_010841 [Agrocybe pediades]|uniref:F-box domain-containing protein n=1 Tax=Agrocybe pediades TaxID=84607 RepID=A0A8H4QLW0_9AGAR|nr:hypothetical protein D9613_010841 [Agrocybe pediades]